MFYLIYDVWKEKCFVFLMLVKYFFEYEMCEKYICNFIFLFLIFLDRRFWLKIF